MHPASLLFAFSAVLGTAPAGAPAPPALPLSEVLSALQRAGCPHPSSQSLPNGALYLTCTSIQKSERDGDIRKLRYLVAQRGSDGKPVLYELVAYSDSSSPRTKIGIRHRMSLSGLTVQHRSDAEFGKVRTETWNLATSPPTLVAESEGGNHDCKESIEVGGANSETPELVAPLCSTDYAHGRQVCSFDALECELSELHSRKVRSVSIPVRTAGSSADPLSCAVTIGGEKPEVLSGTNRKGTRFRVVAEEDSAKKELRLILAAEDKTPHVAPDANASMDAHDHFELWLSSQPLRARCVDTGDRAAYCQERAGVEQLRVKLLPTQQKQVVVQAPGVSPARLALLGATWGPAYLTLTRRGELYAWSQEGALTVLYSDSEAGIRPDSLLATATSVANHPETWGQLASTRFCGPKPLAPIGSSVESPR